MQFVFNALAFLGACAFTWWYFDWLANELTEIGLKLDEVKRAIAKIRKEEN